MSHKDRSIQVHYHRAVRNSPLHKALATHQVQSHDFIKKTEALIKKYGAQSANVVNIVKSIHIEGLNFLSHEAPLKWRINHCGGFRPRRTAEEAADFNFSLEPFTSLYPQGFGLRFGTLSNEFIVSARPEKDGSPFVVEGAELLTKDQLEDLKKNASPEELKHFEQLSKAFWEPPAFAQTNAFTTNKKIDKQNAERVGSNQTLDKTIKHSILGRLLQKSFYALNPI